MDIRNTTRFFCSNMSDKSMTYSFVLLVVVNFCALVFAQEDVYVTIPNGQLKGRKETTARGVTFYHFQEIPYGQAPIGNLRFKDPIPAGPWSGVRDATRNTKICYQTGSSYPSSETESEDCLFVNVYTPTYPSENANLPVMVWIHGGAFLNGMANYYSAGPHWILEGNIVVVTISYRLGPFGFLSTGDSTIPGNYGLKDQNLALQWVRDNIKHFGGDPSKVTITGASAGAASVAYHLQSPKSRGLFRGAIAMSGSNLVPWSYNRQHTSNAYALAAHMGLHATNSQELLQVLQNVPADQLRTAAGSAIPWTFANNGWVHGFSFTPTIDRDFIPSNQYQSIESGQNANVPLLIGIVSEEMLAQAQTLSNIQWASQMYDQNVSALCASDMHLSDYNALNSAGQAIKQVYTYNSFAADISKTVRYYSDNCFTKAIIHHAKMQSQFSDVYFYQFSYHGAWGNNPTYVQGCDRVQHGEDSSYIWCYGGNSNKNVHNAQDVLTSDRYINLLTNFVNTLNPTPQPSQLLQNIIWPKVNPNNFQYLDIDSNLSIKSNPKGETYSKWVQVYEQHAAKPYDTF